MKPMFVSLVLIVLFVLPVSAQSVNDLPGTWSGDWVPESGPRDRVTVEFRRDGDGFTGRLLNPAQLDLTRVEFDQHEGTVVVQAIDPEDSTTYTLEATFEEELTRMRGTMSSGTVTGEVKLVKWTYVPRPR